MMHVRRGEGRGGGVEWTWGEQVRAFVHAGIGINVSWIRNTLHAEQNGRRALMRMLDAPGWDTASIGWRCDPTPHGQGMSAWTYAMHTQDVARGAKCRRAPMRQVDACWDVHWPDMRRATLLHIVMGHSFHKRQLRARPEDGRSAGSIMRDGGVNNFMRRREQRRAVRPDDA